MLLSADANAGDARGVAQLAAWVDETLAGMGCDAAAGTLQSLPAEASTRRFFRVHTGGATFVAMHSPPETEDNARFVRLAKLFRAHGLGTPTVHAFCAERGFLLVEDLGERNFQAAYAEGETDAALEAAVRGLAVLQNVPRAALALYAERRFAAELGIFAEWLVERLLGLRPPAFFAPLCEALVAATQEVPQRPLHRDYHCRNLLWRTDGTVGVVDFQDALVGPVTYDIASLLRDCYHEFDEAVVARWRRRYFDLAAPDISADAFNRAFDLTAVQRQLKAVGIFARLWLRDGRVSHLRDISPVLERIAQVARGHLEMIALADWISSDVLPTTARRLRDAP